MNRFNTIKLFEEFKTVIHNKVEGSEYADKSFAAVTLNLVEKQVTLELTNS